MKKLLAVVLATLVSLSLVACSAVSPASTGATSGVTSEVPAKVTKADVKEQVLLDREGVKITFQGLEQHEGVSALENADKGYADTQIWVKLLVENNGSRDIFVSVCDVAVNDFMVYAEADSPNISPNKKYNETLYFSATDLDGVDIAEIQKIDLQFTVCQDSWEKILFSTDNITFLTNATSAATSELPEKAAKADEKEQVLLEQEGIKITFQGLERCESVNASGDVQKGDADMQIRAKLLVENNSSRNVMVNVHNVAVNDFMVYAETGSPNILPNKKYNATLSFLGASLNDMGIAEIQKIGFKVKVYQENWETTLFDTDTITFSTSATSVITSELPEKVTKADGKEQVLLNKEGVKITFQGLESVKAPGNMYGLYADTQIRVKLLVENSSSSRNVMVSVHNVAVNDFVVNADTNSPDILPNMKYDGTLYFSGASLNGMDIAEIKKIDLKFSVYQNNGNERLFDTDNITLTLAA